MLAGEGGQHVMVRPYSLDLRERVIAARLEGASCRAVARRFGLSVATVVRWGQRHHATGSVAPGKYGGHRRRILEPHRALVRRLVEEHPDRPVRELRDDLAGRGIGLCEDAVRRFLHAEGLSFKKKRVRRGAGPARDSAPPRALASPSGQYRPTPAGLP